MTGDEVMAGACPERTVGVVGLGLIGGSVAKAYKSAGYRVLGADQDTKILGFARLAGVIDDVLEPGGEEEPGGEKAGNLADCGLVFLAVYPGAAIGYVKDNADRFRKGSLVMDCCGVKKAVCDACFPIAEENGFVFVGGHPMAGTERSGIKVSRADLFQGASMVVVPPVFDDIRLLARVKEALKPMGFARFRITRADHHDQMIAYTSQLSHIASNAFVKSPSALEEEGYSGGSFRDLTRVAYLNEKMWAELFMYNREPLLKELDILIGSLNEYRRAIAEGDTAALEKLLRDGRERKEELECRR